MSNRSRRKLDHTHPSRPTIASRSFPVPRAKRSITRKDKEIIGFRPRSRRKKSPVRSRSRISITSRKPSKRSRKKITAIYADGVGRNKIVTYVRHREQ